MIYEKYQIGKATADAYILSNFEDIDINAERPCIVICPGGGYEFLSNREGEFIAQHFMSKGFSCVVLNYSVAPAKFPQQLCELSQTVALVRKNAKAWNIAPEKVSVMGFSAGGHLAASLGTMWHENWLDKESGTTKEQRKPNSLVLGYPVISWDYAHKGTFFNVIGKDKPEHEYQKVSLEKLVSSNMVPTFIWSTWEDKVVPIENSLLFASALRKNNITCELHIYSWGEHGLGLATKECESVKHPIENPRVARWADDCTTWLEKIF